MGVHTLTHHAIYVGNGKVVHFTGGHDGDYDPANARVVLDTFETFQKAARSKGTEVQVHNEPEADDAATVRLRCLVMVGSGGYNPITNNCEDLAWYCLTGTPRSKQRERILSNALQAMLGGGGGTMFDYATMIKDALPRENRTGEMEQLGGRKQSLHWQAWNAHDKANNDKSSISLAGKSLAWQILALLYYQAKLNNKFITERLKTRLPKMFTVTVPTNDPLYFYVACATLTFKTRDYAHEDKITQKVLDDDEHVGTIMLPIMEKMQLQSELHEFTRQVRENETILYNSLYKSAEPDAATVAAPGEPPRCVIS